MSRTARARAVVLLLLGALLLALGLFWPTITVTRLGIFSDTYSIILFVLSLLRGGEYLLFVIVSAFSIVFPLLKIIAGFWFLFARNRSGLPLRFGRTLIGLGRFSMADVFLVALSVFLLKSSQFANVQVHWGVYIYGLSVLAVAMAGKELNMEQEPPTREGGHDR